MSIHPNTPVIIGCGRYTHRAGKDFAKVKSPCDMIAHSARLAARDACGGDGAAAAALLKGLDAVAVVGLTMDADVAGGRTVYDNLPWSVAHRVGIAARDDLQLFYTTEGGNTPQMLVNDMAERIARGRCRRVLLAGAEALHSLKLGLLGGHWRLPDPNGDDGDGGDGDGGDGNGGDDDGPRVLPWGRVHECARDPPAPRAPVVLGAKGTPGVTEQERLHYLGFPVNTYPLFEEALRGALGRPRDEHTRAMARLFSRFSAVAAAPANARHSWFPTRHAPATLAAPTRRNRLVGTPYTKLMNAIIAVDQGAALVLTSYAEATEALGVPPARLVFLRGCADAHEAPWHVAARADLGASPAAAFVGAEAARMAGLAELGLRDPRVAAIDLYSPSNCSRSIFHTLALRVGGTDPHRTLSSFRSDQISAPL